MAAFDIQNITRILFFNYTELSIKSNFSFLKEGSHPKDSAHRAINLGLKSFALTDENSA